MMFDFSSPSTIVGWVFLSLFLVASVMNLVFCYQENEKPRAITKLFCLPLLGFAALCFEPASWLIYLGCFLGAIGDFFLLKKKSRKWLFAGMVAFFLGHVCYISLVLYRISLVGGLPPISWLWIALYALGLSGIVTFLVIKKSKDALISVAGSIYAVSLSGDSAVAIWALSAGAGPYYWLMLVGGLLFLSSDLVLTYTILGKDFPKRDFPIMLLYLLGQCFIVFGLLLA